AARSTYASATSTSSRDLRENLAASGYAASKRRNFPISRSPRATIFSLAAAAAGKSPASFAEFAAANRRSNSSSGDAGFCCALACRHPRTPSRKRHAPRADRLQRMTFVDREGGEWIKAECPGWYLKVHAWWRAVQVAGFGEKSRLRSVENPLQT